jgi:tetratricopeptide (TPR) repeat protein
VKWVLKEFNDQFFFSDRDVMLEFPPPDSAVQFAKRAFFKGHFLECRQMLNSRKNTLGNTPESDLFRHYARIKLAGKGRSGGKPVNPYAKQKTEWQIDLEDARNLLLVYLRSGHQDILTNILVAESYLWEEDFSTAEIFLDRAYLQNPFEIEMLVNLTHLHFSRYREFGFKGDMDIYRHILEICPIYQNVLIKWCDYILEQNPSHTAPPKIAIKKLRDYLDLSPNSYQAWLMFGKIYAKGFDRDIALDAFMTADSIKPGDGMIHYNIGALYYEWDKPGLAKKYLALAIEYDNYLDAYLYLGAILKEEGKYRQALEKFRYRVANKKGEDDFYAYQAMKGIQECLDELSRQDNK